MRPRAYHLILVEIGPVVLARVSSSAIVHPRDVDLVVGITLMMVPRHPRGSHSQAVGPSSLAH